MPGYLRERLSSYQRGAEEPQIYDISNTLQPADLPYPADRVQAGFAGSRADLMVLDAPSHVHLAYRPGVPLVTGVWIGGRPL